MFSKTYTVPYLLKDGVNMNNYLNGKNQKSNDIYNSNMFYSRNSRLLNNIPENTGNTVINHKEMQYAVDVPINLAKSLEGKYFLGYADYLPFGEGTNTWARLYNPENSGVNLHVTVWTVSDVSQTSYTAQMWFNSTPPGLAQESTNVTPANTAIVPLPSPHVKLQYGSSVRGLPLGGVLAFIRRGQPGATMLDDEQGKFIFPPGGSFMIMLSNPQTPARLASGSIAFGWWEEPI